MARAAAGGHKDLVEFFMDKGANDLEEGIFQATERRHKDLVNFLWKKMLP